MANVKCLGGPLPENLGLMPDMHHTGRADSRTVLILSLVTSAAMMRQTVPLVAMEMPSGCQ